ncbi:MAG: NAD+ synthase [Acidobacteriota bacterium]|nr:NAD+ synthase [Acidobacteriota bacterium]
MDRLRVALCQLDTVVGDVGGNAERVLSGLARAEEEGADLVAFPELALTGYPPEDLLLKPAFLADNLAALSEVAGRTSVCAAVVGFVDVVGTEDLAEAAAGAAGAGVRSREAAVRGAPRLLRNAVAVCAGGRVAGVYHKRLLPNYGVFDEERWFGPGTGPLGLYTVGGVEVGVSICEDLWFAEGPVGALGRGGARVVVNVNASPYAVGRLGERLTLLRRRVAEAGCPVAYVNQVGGQDELVFDGGSLVMGAGGEVLAGGAQFVQAMVVADLELPPAPRAPSLASTPVSGPRPRREPLAPPPLPEPLSEEAEVYGALVLGTRDYLRKNGFTDAVVGLSGGIDSSLVALVAADALGPEHVHGLSMPSRYSSEGSRTDAEALAAALGIDLTAVPIEAAHRALGGLVAGALGAEPPGLTDENLQSRIRGVLLMAVSNAKGWIVLTTGNKSELATGYSTLYGDSAGGFAVIKDVPKTLVYRLCRYRNDVAGRALVPEGVLTKAPSAELRPGQRDDQSLPPYEVLDPVLDALVARDESIAEVVHAGFPAEVVERVARLVDSAEYKRRQSPPGIRISAKAFGKDRRMPITNRYLDRSYVPPVPSAPAGGDRDGGPGE